MDSTYDAIIVGGGIIGASAAYHLARGGAKTLLVDRRDRGRATSAGAGILAPEISARGDNWFNFAVKAVAYYPTLLSLLDEDDAPSSGYGQCGILVVAVDGDERQPFDDAADVIFARQEERGTPTNKELRRVDSDEAQLLFPPLTTVLDAIYYSGAARVDGRLLERSLRFGAAQHGVEMLDASVESLLMEGNRVVGVEVVKPDQDEAAASMPTTLTTGTKSFGAHHQRLMANSVLIAGGAWSPSFGEQLNLSIPVEPHRGQIIHLNLPNVETGNWPMVQGYRGHYIVCWSGDSDDAASPSNAANPGAGNVPQGRVVVGATRETDTGYQPVATAEGIAKTLNEALRVAPGLASASLYEVRVGLRPASPDGLPYLGQIPKMEGIYVATGHGPTGLQLGPYSAKLVADLMLGKTTEVDLSPFAVGRFS